MVGLSGFRLFQCAGARAGRRWRDLIAASLCAVAIQAAPAAAAILFADDFNRPDSTSVGNGWVSVTEGGGPGFQVIQDNKLINPSVSRTGIYRPFAFDAPIRITGRLFDGDGHPSAGLGGHYEGTFAVLAGNDVLQKGYGITVNRNDALGGNTFLSRFDNGVQIDIVNFPAFHITSEAVLDVVFALDGSMTGSLVNPLTNDQFDFSFGAHAIASTGDNFMFVSPGNGRPNYDLLPVNLPGLDDLVIQSVDVPGPSMLLLLVGVLLVLACLKGSREKAAGPGPSS